MNTCPRCKNGQGFQSYFDLHDMDTGDDVTWYVWKNDENDQLCKMIEEGIVEDLRDYTGNITPKFLVHCYVKRQQAAKYSKEREAATSPDLDASKALLQVDYSENYTCVYQDEIQSAHWKQHQVSLFTAALWHSGELHSKVVASDNLTHSKETLVAYVSRLLDDIPATVKSVSIWSDGPSSQFKNHYIAASLHALEEKHGINILWNFFATSHGKGPVDGIGGSVKRHVWTAVKTRKVIVNDAASFVLACNAPESTVEVFEMSAADIAQRNTTLNLDQVFSDAPAIEGILAAHHFHVSNGATVAYPLSKDVSATGTGSDEEETDEVDASGMDEEGADEAFDITVKDWCVVIYDGELYPGEVQSQQGNSYEVSTMAKSGGYWKIPKKEDKIFYTRDKIKQKLAIPILINARGLYKFPDFPE